MKGRSYRGRIAYLLHDSSDVTTCPAEVQLSPFITYSRASSSSTLTPNLPQQKHRDASSDVSTPQRYDSAPNNVDASCSSATQISNTTQRCHFLELPPELWYPIYKFLLSPYEVTLHPHSERSGKPAPAHVAGSEFEKSFLITERLRVDEVELTFTDEELPVDKWRKEAGGMWCDGFNGKYMADLNDVRLGAVMNLLNSIVRALQQNRQ